MPILIDTWPFLEMLPLLQYLPLNQLHFSILRPLLIVNSRLLLELQILWVSDVLLTILLFTMEFVEKPQPVEH